MTDGTSQGLFIVVAIVIFGIFTLMAYILFEDTLSPALASMFTDATEKSNERLQNGLTVLQDEDFSKWGVLTPKNTYTVRTNTYGEMDSSTKRNNKDTLKVTYTQPHDGDTMASKNDLVTWLYTPENDVFEIGDKVSVSFYAKSDKPVNYFTRLGSSLGGAIKSVKVDENWVKVDIKLTVTSIYPAIMTNAVVMWVDSPSTIWMSDYTVKLLNK